MVTVASVPHHCIWIGSATSHPSPQPSSFCTRVLICKWNYWKDNTGCSEDQGNPHVQCLQQRACVDKSAVMLVSLLLRSGPVTHRSSACHVSVLIPSPSPELHSTQGTRALPLRSFIRVVGQNRNMGECWRGVGRVWKHWSGSGLWLQKGLVKGSTSRGGWA